MTAEVTISQSNNAAVATGAEISQLLSEERLALNAVPSDRLLQLQVKPNRQGIFFSQPGFEYSRATLSALPTVSGGKQWECLAEALYFEARGESVEGQFAVAEVILNRVESNRFPDTICGVVHQGTGQRHRCQFSYNCDGKLEVVNDRRAWNNVAKVARLIMDGIAPRDLTGGATHYHTTAVNPRWAQVFDLTTTIGVHRFYRMTPRRQANG
ncbi:MAG: cell wall hydrolase [Paracoccaceae bacterium]|nr:cell wall hydrolase [Paracoccaceae bacterium]